MKNAEYDLVLRFDDQSESFVHGFEAGGLYLQMRQGAIMISDTVHTANRDIIERMAEKEGYLCEIEATEYDEWMYVNLRKIFLTADSLPDAVQLN